MNEPEHPAPRPAGQTTPIVTVEGAPYTRDARGSLVPIASIKTVDLMIDETVRLIIGAARNLSERIARFKADTFEQVSALQALIAQEYGASVGGKKGNITLTSFDGCLKVQVQVADLIEFGPELQAAKTLIDDCLSEWAADSGVELRSLVNRVFEVGKEGQINRAELFMLLRVEIADDRWQRAMNAIRDSIRVIGSRTYVRFYYRDTPEGPWRAIPIDLAAA